MRVIFKNFMKNKFIFAFLRKLLLTTILCSTWLAVRAASFDCSKEVNDFERTICNNKDLSLLDESLVAIYSKAKLASTSPSDLKKDQLNWIKSARGCRTNVDCISNSYNKRLEELNKVSLTSVAKESDNAALSPKNTGIENNQNSISTKDTEKNSTNINQPQEMQIGPDGKKLKSVQAEGVGGDLESALKNAAENALMEVVGTFIDAQKKIDRNTQILNGIKNETKNISSRINEYSQGTIKSVKILDASKDGLLTRVKSEVVVVVDDFHAYIKELAEGKTDVKPGLFAALSTELKQKNNLENIVVDLVLPVISGEVLAFIVNEPLTIEQGKDLIEKQYRDSKKISNYGENMVNDGIKELHGSVDNFTAFNSGKLCVYLPVSVSLRQEFYENAQKTLKSIAVNETAFDVYDHYKDYGFSYNADAVLGLGEFDATSITDIKMYQLKGVEPKLKNKFEWWEHFDDALTGRAPGLTMPAITGKPALFPKMIVEVIGSGGKVLESHELRGNNSLNERNSILVIDDSFFSGPAWNLLVSWGYHTHPTILNSRKFSLLLAIDENASKDTKQINIRLSK